MCSVGCEVVTKRGILTGLRYDSSPLGLDGTPGRSGPPKARFAAFWPVPASVVVTLVRITAVLRSEVKFTGDKTGSGLVYGRFCA